VIVRGWDEPFAKLRASHSGPSWRQARAIIVRSNDGLWVTAVSEREGFKMMPNPSANGYLYARLAGAGPEPIPTSVDHQIEIWIPRRSNLALQSTLGAVVIDGVEGEMIGSVATGNIEVLNAGGRAALDTKFGDIRVSNSVLGGSVKTECGSVVSSGVTGNFNATTTFDPSPYKDLGPTAKTVIVEGIPLADYCNPRLRRMGELSKRMNENNPYGDIVLDSAPNGGTLSTGRGGSIVVRASGGHISASNSTGNIELSKVRGDATARSRGGNITIRLVNTDGAEHHVNAQTANGNVTIEIPDELNARIEAEVVTTDSSTGKGRYARIIDLYGLATGVAAPDSGSAAREGAVAPRIVTTMGRGTGRILVRVTDGDIIFQRAKR